MRVNIYAEEMTDRIEIISKEIDGQTFTGLRLYLELPVTVDGQQYQGPFMHRPGDDDSSAVTFWGKRDLRTVLDLARQLLDEHYAAGDARRAMSTRFGNNPIPAQAIGMITDERARQVNEEGFTAEHDDEHDQGELAVAAVNYITEAARTHSPIARDFPSLPWPWEGNWWKPSDDPMRNLVKGLALGMAELERHLRIQEAEAFNSDAGASNPKEN